MRRAFILALLLVPAPSALALDLVEMVLLKAEGKTDAEVLKRARAEGIAFELTDENLGRLRRSGLREETILELARVKLRGMAASEPAPAPVPAPAPTPAPEPVPAPAPGPEPAGPPKPAAPECAACRSTGLVPCPRHRLVITHAGARYALLHDSRAEPPACCGGTGVALCPRCRSEPGELALKARAEAVRLRRASWEDFDRTVAGEGGGGRPYHVETPHLSLAADLSPGEAQQLAAGCEGLLAKLRARFGDAFDFTTGADTHFYVAKDRMRYAPFLDALDEHVKFKPHLLAHAKEHAAAITVYQPISLATCVHGQKLIDDQHFMCHQFGHILVNRYDRYRRMPMWLSEGFADECERLSTNAIHVYCFDYDPKTIDLRGDWAAKVRGLAGSGKAASWKKVFGKEAMDMSAQDYQQSWSMVRFLMEADAAKFLAFLKEVKATDDPLEDVLEKVYKLKLDQIEKSWRTWAARAR